MSPFHRLYCVRPVAWIGRALVKCHGDIRAQRLLYIHYHFWGEKQPSPINVRMKFYPVLFYLIDSRQAEYLESSAIGQYGPVPPHNPVQAARLAYYVMPWSQIQMIRVAKDYGRFNLYQVPWRHCLYRSLCSYRHEAWRIYYAMFSIYPTKPCVRFAARF